MTYEQQLLGALIKSPSDFKEIALSLKEGDLAMDSHKKIYKTLSDMATAEEWIDYISVKERVNDEKIAGEITYMVKNAEEMDRDQLKSLIGKVKDEAIKYKLRNVGASLQNDTTYSQPIKDILQSTTRRLFEISEDRQKIELSSPEIVAQMLEERDKFADKDMWGYPTGFSELDATTRGMQKGHLWVVGAYTSVGKSWFCLKFANEAHKSGAKVLFLSTEMIEKRLGWRYVALNARLAEYDMISGSLSPESKERMEEALDRLKQGDFRLISGITSVEEIIFYVKREVAKNNCDLVVVDFLQNLATGRDEYEELSGAIRKLQILALNENVAMIVASQVSRESNKTKLGGTFGYKGSGTIEACADVGIVLKKDENNKRNIIVDVRKNRNGLITAFNTNVEFDRGIMEEGDVVQPD